MNSTEKGRQIARPAHTKELTARAVEHAVIAGDHAEDGDDPKAIHSQWRATNRNRANDLSQWITDVLAIGVDGNLLRIRHRATGEQPGEDHKCDERQLSPNQTAGDGTVWF